MYTKALLIFLALSGATLNNASKTCDPEEEECPALQDTIQDDNSAIQAAFKLIKQSKTAAEQSKTAAKNRMSFEHRAGQVKLTFSEKFADEESRQCVLKGNLVDEDNDVGGLDISFEVTILNYAVTDTATGETIFSERLSAMGTETATKYMVVEDDAFTFERDDEEEDEEDGGASLKKKVKNFLHLGKGISIDSHDQLLSLRRDAFHRNNASFTQQLFETDVEILMSDIRDNAIVELGVAFANAGITGENYPCSYGLLMLAQQLADYGKNLSDSTRSDVTSQQQEQTALLYVGSNETGESGCNCYGCSDSCGNEEDGCGCFGRCGAGCESWSWVCGDGHAHQGCCEHDGFCSCDSMSNPWCVGFFGDCWDPGCAATRCELCDDCRGTTRRRYTGYCRSTRRRRRSGGWR